MDIQAYAVTAHGLSGQGIFENIRGACFYGSAWKKIEEALPASDVCAGGGPLKPRA
jgi:hypothetical protein